MFGQQWHVPRCKLQVRHRRVFARLLGVRNELRDLMGQSVICRRTASQSGLPHDLVLVDDG